jgi:hypothetical protein
MEGRKTMRKLITATAACALAVGLATAPGAVAKKSVKQVPGTVSVAVSPATTTPTTTALTVTGNVKANSSCRKDRTVRFAFVNSATLAETPAATTAVTRSNGDYTAALAPPTTDGTYVLRATVDETIRTKKVKGKRKGASKGNKQGDLRKRKFNCLEIVGTSAPTTVDAP